MCQRLALTDQSSRTSKDLSEQCIKVLELICTREAGSVFEAGGLTKVLSFIRDNGHLIHKDTLHSAMAVVSRLCTKMEPHDESLPSSVECLSTLLRHEDSHVADGALKCFASLADRFIRKNVDPVPLGKNFNLKKYIFPKYIFNFCFIAGEHGLTKELLNRLSVAGITSNKNNNNATSNSGGASNQTPETCKSSASISTTISLLSTLCRGSSAITYNLLRSNLPAAIESALGGDERCILDTMRLIDLLLVLLFEGRDSLPRSASAAAHLTGAGSGGRLSALRRMDSASEKTHKQLIDCIRLKDTDALMEAIDSGNVEVNFMDDVGQTLLNWASAFGTQEMVEFLCLKGADVNKGQRSSSLHYAACFGRPAIARVLLRFGANPDLRDEDGKTPLDKARERNDEGHREVASILQSPADWLRAPPILEASAESGVAGGESSETADEESSSSDEPKGPKGDPEMIPLYVRTLLPMFCQTYQATMITSVKKSSLGLIKKIIHYLTNELMIEVCTENVHLIASVVEVLTSVLDNEEDDEGHLACLQIIQDLMNKDEQGLFLEQFAKLGLYTKVHALTEGVLIDSQQQQENNSPCNEICVPPEETDSPAPAASLTVALTNPSVEDAKEIVHGKGYYWKDWSIARGRDCLYIWSDAAALELSNGSNGWFRFILDGKLATMYSSGSPGRRQ